MLTYDELISLEEATADAWTLTVYLNGREGDPAARHAWRTEIRNQIARLEREFEDGSNGVREAFHAATDRLEEHIAGIEGNPPEPGWMAVISGDEVRYAGTIPVTVANLAWWDRGLLAAPYVRALKQLRPIIVALGDHHSLRLLRYAEGGLEEVEVLQAAPAAADTEDGSVSRKPSRGGGVRGDSAAGKAERASDQAYRQLLKQAIERITALTGEACCCVLGGLPEVVSDLMAALPGPLAERTLAEPSLTMDEKIPVLLEEMRSAAHTLRARQQLQRVRAVLDAARSGGRGATGQAAVSSALEERRVDSLLITKEFIRLRVREANELVKSALQQHAEVEEISGEAARILTDEAEGVAARLRYVL